ncbi:restriction endonuclease subunit S [Glutamicibacter sp. NPDC087344]|uniref:restriction endonuclease subunit S n=1 Tax=Glutamicibacter sp. NPDC087344 TaxID=3363994 RepID=UPI003828B351
MRGNIINLNEARRINDEVFAEWTIRLAPEPGDLLFAREAPVGPVVEIPKGLSIAPGQRTMLLRADPTKAVSRFLRYYLISPATQARLHALAHGSTVPHLRLPVVRNFEVSLPELPAQKAIAEVLGALDDKIAVNDRIASTAETLARTLLANLRPSVPLSDIVTHARNSLMPAKLGTPTIAHFSLPAFDSDQLPEFCHPDTIKSNKFHVKNPSVLISKLNPRFPRVWDLSSLPDEPAVTSTEFLVLEPRHSSTSVLWAILRQETFARALESKVSGTSGSHQRVKPSDLLATEVIDPRSIGKDVQLAISSLSETAVNSRSENSDLAKTRDVLLPQLMSGRLQVKDAEVIVESAM